MEGECVICKGPFSLLYGGKELYDSLTCNHLLMANFSLYIYASVAPILMLALTLIKRSYKQVTVACDSQVLMMFTLQIDYEEK